MSTPRQAPLNWNVPIVNPDRTPTKEFMQKWLTQQSINSGIPSLSTAPEVSAVLDLLGSAPNKVLLRGASQWSAVAPSLALDVVGSVRGDLLVRKTANWDRLASPADTAKFLNGATDPVWSNVHDSDLSLSDITTNNVSTTRHGFAPKAPNDATKFLDGTGAYSSPAAPAGGGGWAVTNVSGLSTDTNTRATKGTAFESAVDVTVDKIIYEVNVANIGDIFSAFIATTNAGTWPLTTTVATAIGRFTAIATGYQTLVFPVPPTLLLAKTLYTVCGVLTNRTATTAIQLYAVSTTNVPWLGIPWNMTHFNSSTVTQHSNTSDTPSGVTAGAVAAANNFYRIGLHFTA